MSRNAVLKGLQTAVVVVCLALPLGACQPEIPGGEPSDAAPSDAVEDMTSSAISTSVSAMAPVLAGIDLNQPLSLMGTEPFWSVKVSVGDIVFSSPEETGLRFPAAPFTVSATSARLETEGLQARLTSAPCSDGMSDRAYPLVAEVRMGERLFKGCAMPTAQMDASQP